MPNIHTINLKTLEMNGKIIHQGGNSEVRVVKIKNEEFILKKYNTLQDLEIRMKKEVAALRLLEEIKFDYAPRIISINAEEGLVMMTKFNGQKINKLEGRHIKSIIKTMQQLKRNNINNIVPIENASSSFIDMKQTKVELINDLSYEIILAKDKSDKKLENHLIWIKDKLERREIDELIEKLGTCEVEKQIFSFSDVGIHTCIEDDSKMYFFDFEHSGWDDPIKQLCDWILSPRNSIEYKCIQQLCESFFRAFPWHHRENLWMFLEITNIKWQIISIKYRRKLSTKTMTTNDEIINRYHANTKLINNLTNFCHYS